MIESNAGRNRTGAGTSPAARGARGTSKSSRPARLEVRRPSSAGSICREPEARELLDVVAGRRAVRGEVARGRPASRSPAASGSGSRHGTAGDGFVCGHSPSGAVRTNGSARNANATVQRSSVPSTRCAELVELGAVSGSSGTAAPAPRCRRRALQCAPRCDSMYAETSDGNVLARHHVQRRAQLTRLDDRAATSARVSCSLRNPSSRDQSATYGDGAYCACSATSRSTASHDRRPLPARAAAAARAAFGSARGASRDDGGLQQVARRIGEERGQVGEQHAVRDEPLPRVRAAREEAERRAHRRTACGGTSRAASARRSAAGTRRRRGRASRGSPPKRTTVPPGPHESRPRRAHASLGARRLDHDVRARARPRSRRRTARRARAAPRGRRRSTGQPPASATHAASISPIGPAPRIVDLVARLHARRARRRAGSTRAARPSPPPRARGRRHLVQVHRRDPLRARARVGVGAGRETRGRGTARRAHSRRTRRTAPSSRRRRGGPSTMPQNSCPNGAGGSRSEHRMAAPIRLQVGAVGERELDLHEHVPRPRLGLRNVLDAQVAGRVEQRRLSRREDHLERRAAAVELEPLVEALERQRGHLRQLEVAERLDARPRTPRASRSATRRRAAPCGRRASSSTGSVTRWRGEDEHRPAGLDPAERLTRARGRGDDRRVDGAVVASRRGRAPARPVRRGGRRRRRRRRAAASACTQSSPTAPQPTTSTRPRGTVLRARGARRRAARPRRRRRP